MSLLFPAAAHAAEALPDLGPALSAPWATLLVLAPLALGAGLARAKRTRKSLALLALLAAGFALLTQIAPRAISPYAGLAAFLGIFGVIYLLGQFDAPD